MKKAGIEGWVKKYFLFILLLTLIIFTIGCAKSDSTKGKTGNTLETAILKSGWHNKDEGGWRWIGKDAVAIVDSGTEGKMFIAGYLPPEILGKVYGGSLSIIILVDGKELAVKNLTMDNVKDGNWYVSGEVPKNAELMIEIKLNKSYVPVQFNLGPDTRKLGVIINKLETK